MKNLVLAPLQAHFCLKTSKQDFSSLKSLRSTSRPYIVAPPCKKSEKLHASIFHKLEKPCFGSILGALGPKPPSQSLYKLDDTLILCNKIRNVLQTILERTNEQRVFHKTFTSWVRSSRLQMFFKIGALKIFAIFTEKHLCCSLFLIE